MVVLSVLIVSIIDGWRKGHIGGNGREPLHQGGRTAETGGKERTGGKEAVSGRKVRWVAIIIDDIGYDLTQVDDLLRIPAPLTFAVLPHCTHSIEAAEKLHRAGKEILLHLPMEPQGFPEKNPGKGVILSDMNEDEIYNVLAEDLRAVPHTVGVNNHMGSKFMENGQKLGTVFQILKKEKLFFVDSLTTGYSQGRITAEDAGIPFIARDIFIDNSHNSGDTYGEFTKLVKAFKHRRKLVVIGHPYPETIAAMKMFVASLRSEGIEIVTISEFSKK